jgi:O-antigen/teichoic acid export membrane protein
VGSHGERALGIFTATAFLVSSGNLIINALGQSAFVRLAKHYAAGDVRGFNSLLLKLVGIAAVLGLGGIGVSVLFGRTLLTLLYRPEYAEHTDVLIAMMVGGAMTYVAGLLGSAVTSARCFARQIPSLAAVASATIASKFLMPYYGLVGAAFAVIITSTVLCAGEDSLPFDADIANTAALPSWALIISGPNRSTPGISKSRRTICGLDSIIFWKSSS